MKDLNVKVNLQANITEFNNAMNRAKDSIANSFSGKGVKLFTEEMNNTFIELILLKYVKVSKTSSIVKNENESVIDYDNRINLADYQHIGYAFFECSNYNLSNHSYSLYIVWNQKVNSILEDPLPQVGFSIKCSENTAKQLSFETEGQPVFAKFISIIFSYLASASISEKTNITDSFIIIL